MGVENADFSGYATKAGLKCSDGRTILPDAFKHQDGVKVPLVWQHGHESPSNILGHAILENRADGVYCHAFFNTSEPAKLSKQAVQHGDVVSLSIYANKLIERSKEVMHGVIREVSLVLSGANPGALIDNVNLAHGEFEEDEEAIIYTGLEISHADTSDDLGSDATVEEVYESFTDQQKDVLHFMIGAALEANGVKHSDLDDGTEEETEEETPEETEETDSEEETSEETETTDTESGDAEAEETPAEGEEPEAADADAQPEGNQPEGDQNTDVTHEDSLNHQEGNKMSNVFEQNGVKAEQPHLTHDQLSAIVTSAKKNGSFKDAFLEHAVEYGIENIDFLFPDAKTLSNNPELITRKQEWVDKVINGVKKSPFSRIKTLSADVTHDEARAKGYVKGTLKKEEWFALAKRTTTPTTIYKKQKLDRDDIIDITDLDVVAWLKAEMRLMLDEEIARAILVGDGREIDDDDKVDENCIRPIAYEDDFYAHKITIPANTTGDALVEAILRARPFYRGKGNPTLFVTEELLTDLILVKDKMGRRLYASPSELAFTLRVSDIVTVPVMETVDVDGGDLMAILVNLSDYTMGADKGGAISMFDDFDIDYNQFKYLMETRMSGALTAFKTAIVFKRSAGTLVTPAVPTFNAATGVVTIPGTTGVVYKQDGVTKTAGAQTAVAAGVTTEVTAEPASTYYFAHNIDTDWEFTRNA